MTPASKPAAWNVDLSAVPFGLKDALPTGLRDPLALYRDLPSPRNEAVLTRTDPVVETLSRYVLDTALDPQLGIPVASRAGVTRTKAVALRTTLLLLRFRFHVDLPSSTGIHQEVCEEARFVAFTGSPEKPDWLDVGDVNPLLAATPDGNVDPEFGAELIEAVAESTATWYTHLGELADDLALELLDAHRRVRSGAGTARRGLAVTAQKPVDVLGVYIFLPVAVT